MMGKVVEEINWEPSVTSTCARCGYRESRLKSQGYPSLADHVCPGTIEDRLTRIEDMLKQLVASK